MTIALPTWLGAAMAFLLCGAALWKGGREERLTAAGVLLSFAASVLLRDNSWSSLQRPEFVADTALFGLLATISLRTAKFWPLAAAGFQLLAVMTHVAKIVDPNLQEWAYITANVIWTYLVLVALCVGTWNSWRGAAQPAMAEAAAPAGATRR